MFKWFWTIFSLGAHGTNKIIINTNLSTNQILAKTKFWLWPPVAWYFQTFSLKTHIRLMQLKTWTIKCHFQCLGTFTTYLNRNAVAASKDVDCLLKHGLKHTNRYLNLLDVSNINDLQWTHFSFSCCPSHPKNLVCFLTYILEKRVHICNA